MIKTHEYGNHGKVIKMEHLRVGKVRKGGHNQPPTMKKPNIIPPSQISHNSLMDKGDGGYPMSRDHGLPFYKCGATTCIVNSSGYCFAPSKCVIGEDGKCSGFEKRLSNEPSA